MLVTQPNRHAHLDERRPIRRSLPAHDDHKALYDTYVARPRADSAVDQCLCVLEEVGVQVGSEELGRGSKNGGEELGRGLAHKVESVHWGQNRSDDALTVRIQESDDRVEVPMEEVD